MTTTVWSTKADLGTRIARNDGAGVTTSTSWTFNDAIHRTTTKVGSKTPGFRSPNRVGRLMPLNYAMWEHEYRYSTGHRNSWSVDTRTDRYGYRHIEQVGQFGSTEGFGNVTIGKDVNEMSKLIEKVNQDILRKIKNSSVNMAVAIAEGHQTVNMVANAATAIAGCISGLKGGNFVAAANALGVGHGIRANSRFNRQYARDVGGAVSSGWLELQYGWKPLLQNVYGLADELARHQQDALMVTVKSRQWRTIPLSADQTVNNGNKYVTRRSARGARKYEVEVAITFSRPGDARRTAVQTGLTNPALVAWEIVPYSFVVDWFLPIGAWLETFDATLGLTFRSGYRSEYFSGGVEYKTVGTGVDNYDINHSDHLVSSESYVSFNRTVLSGFPSVGLPRFKNPLSLGHMANGLALLSQAVRGHPGWRDGVR